MPLWAGTRLGPYEILAPIGAGGMGEVYRAKDTMLGREVAIKALPDALARDPERLARLKREAKVLASLNHPNIGQIYGVESQALVMELVEGKTLDLLAGQHRQNAALAPGSGALWVSALLARRQAPGVFGRRRSQPRGHPGAGSRSRHRIARYSSARPEPVAGVDTRRREPGVLVLESGLVFGKSRVWSQHPMLDLGSPPVGTYDLAPDGKRFAVVLNADGTADPKPITHLTLLLNFFDELRRRVPASNK